MADTFTRDGLVKYEKAPQTKVPDTTNPFRGARSAGVASASDVAAAEAGRASGQPVDITPGGGAPRGAASAVVADDSPVVDEDGALGDPTDSGEGTSDELADPSTAVDDPGVVADPNADLTGDAGDEEPVTPAPVKGSAQERIVELNDKLEGAMVFGKAVQEQWKETLAENARLRAERSAPTSSASVAAPPVEDTTPGPMPDMADPDVAFDTDKYRSKMQEWSTKNARHEARQIVREMTGAAQANTLMDQVNKKVETYASEHPEFAEVVTNNPVLKANQLAPDAGLAVARSAFTAELLMKFGNDPAFAIRVAKMHPADQLLIVGEMVAEIKADKKAGKTTTTTAPSNRSNPARSNGAQPVARKSTTTNAPPPPRPTPAAGRTSYNPLDPSGSMEDFVRNHRGGKENARKENRKLRGLN